MVKRLLMRHTACSTLVMVILTGTYFGFPGTAIWPCRVQTVELPHHRIDLIDAYELPEAFSSNFTNDAFELQQPNHNGKG